MRFTSKAAVMCAAAILAVSLSGCGGADNSGGKQGE